MKHRFSLALTAVAGLALVIFPAMAQEGTWRVSGGAGYGWIGLGSVEKDLERDVEGYNNAGYKLPRFSALSPAVAYTTRGSYRFSRDYSLSLTIHYDGRTVQTSWSDAERSLSLKRRIKALVFSTGLAYHFPTDEGNDLFAEVQIGMLFARATSYALRTHTYKLTTDSLILVTEVLDDTRGVFTKSKMIVSAEVGGSVQLIGPFVLQGEVLYRLGQVGQIDGTVTTFGQSRDQTTSVDFNFSGFLVLVSLGIEFY